MCDKEQRDDAGMAAQASASATSQLQRGYDTKTELANPTLRDRLEAKRNRLSRELVQVEEALRLIYSDPNVERIVETLQRARVL